MKSIPEFDARLFDHASERHHDAKVDSYTHLAAIQHDAQAVGTIGERSEVCFPDRDWNRPPFDEALDEYQKAFSLALVNHYRSVRVKNKAPDNMLYVDPLAAAVVIDPSIVTKSIVASPAVELGGGLTRGMTLVDPSGRLGTPKITFVEQVDLAKVDAFYARSVAYVPNHKKT